MGRRIEMLSDCFDGRLEPHSHEGTWTIFWLTKTGYDYGFGDFCFSSEEQMQVFIKKVKEDYEPNHI
jgi:hypothetical protein